MQWGTSWAAWGVLFVSLFVSGNAFAVNKCVDVSGRTSFQDAPCAAGQKAEEINAIPSSKGVNPMEGRKLLGASSSAPVSAPVANAPLSQRSSDCPDAEAMAKLQVEAESIALPLPIRNQKRQDFEALKQRCG